ncbi:GntR family transcriptional regulator [Labrys monachus]|uniref:DNA-binding GntR family transcriptional regulator n=1 Tax=Labrys monachus TaxID=217067 RepID=A0ABU0F7V1_9HYPH|nr:GntR family transcriptional regulator [Labrys monachus]MDQ0390686.1 DNA-binding GntR family transcriptional regulator [Labrys monachus]
MAKRAKGRERGGAPAPARRLSDEAYDRILEALFDRRVPAGAFVSQNELCAIVDVPVAPLRDALRLLEAEGILRIHPRSGIEFVRPGLELTRATFQFRAIVERAAIRMFAEQAEEAEIEAIRARHAALIGRIEKKGLAPDDLAEVDQMERLFHNAVIASLRNPLIDANYRRMHNYLRLLRLDRKLTAPVVLRTLREHLDILVACRARDAKAAEAALDAHFRAAIQRNLGLA